MKRAGVLCADLRVVRRHLAAGELSQLLRVPEERRGEIVGEDPDVRRPFRPRCCCLIAAVRWREGEAVRVAADTAETGLVHKQERHRDRLTYHSLPCDDECFWEESHSIATVYYLAGYMVCNLSEYRMLLQGITAQDIFEWNFEQKLSFLDQLVRNQTSAHIIASITHQRHLTKGSFSQII